jgi:hypothetical protein
MRRAKGLGVGLAFSVLVASACSITPEAGEVPDASTMGGTSCSNGVLDEGEEGIDCGGDCGKCDGAECDAGEECASGSCTDNTCDPPASKTCGVGLPTLCDNGEPCVQDLDCASDYCNGLCAAPAPGAHEDGRRNAGETGVDCGGTVAEEKPCPAGEGCKTDDDCISVCKEDKLCDAPGPTDGKKNNGETDVDCGGPNAPKCALGKVCDGNDDCELLACTDKTCVTPTSSDGIQNGGESDVDCGGAGVSAGDFSYEAPRCKDAQTCVLDADCVTGACSPVGVCVAKSCDTAETAGITTCGAREVGDPAATHETCCKSLPLPTRGKRLDKYEITAGRFRTFLDTAGPNVRAWVTGFAAANPTHPLAVMLAAYPTVLQLYPAAKTGPLNVVGHMALDLDNYSGIRGCYNGAGGYGHNTYWQPAADLATYGIPARPLARTVTDAKSLNCAQPIMFAAFCAWDGGELAQMDDLLDAWGAAAYPWGATPVPQVTASPPCQSHNGVQTCPTTTNYNWCNGNAGVNGDNSRPGTGGFRCQNPTLGVNGNFYRFPGGTNLANDQSPFIGSPGRFPMDATAAKGAGESWMDLFANFPEYTGDFGGPATDFCDLSRVPGAGQPTCTRTTPGAPATTRTGTPYTGIPRVRILGRSWEGHQYNRGNTATFAATFQYGKFGARCARPVQ